MKNWIYNLILAVEAAVGIISALFVVKALLDTPLALAALIILVIVGIAFYVTKNLKAKFILKNKN